MGPCDLYASRDERAEQNESPDDFNADDGASMRLGERVSHMIEADYYAKGRRAGSSKANLVA